MHELNLTLSPTIDGMTVSMRYREWGSMLAPITNRVEGDWSNVVGRPHTYATPGTYTFTYTIQYCGPNGVQEVVKTAKLKIVRTTPSLQAWSEVPVVARPAAFRSVRSSRGRENTRLSSAVVTSCTSA